MTEATVSDEATLLLNTTENISTNSTIIEPTVNSLDAFFVGIDYDTLPEAETVELFLEFPMKSRPKQEFLVLYFNDDDTFLTHVVKNQNISAVAALVKAGADTNQFNRKGITPISAAAHKGNIEVMQLLIDGGALVNAINHSGSTALIQVIHFQYMFYPSLSNLRFSYNLFVL